MQGNSSASRTDTSAPITGDMNRPIYRHLAEKKWRARARLINEQRITQMSVTPDVLPSIDLKASVEMSYYGTKLNSSNRIIPRTTRSGQRVSVQPGEYVASMVAEQPPKLDVQVFDKGERLVTVAIVDPDVPNLAKDGFDYRCQFLASNIKIGPAAPTIRLAQLKPTSVLLPWEVPTAIKGGPYHRIAIIVLEQPEGVVDVAKAMEKVQRKGFVLRSFVDRHALKAVGATLFRIEHDEWMDDVMRRNGFEKMVGMELKRKRVEPLPYKKKDGSRYR